MDFGMEVPGSKQRLQKTRELRAKRIQTFNNKEDYKQTLRKRYFKEFVYNPLLDKFF